MHTYNWLPFLLLVLLLQLPTCCARACESKRVSRLAFENTRRCPSPAASLLPHKLASKLQCAAACSRLPTCNAFYFDKPKRQCFHGDACSKLEQWTDGDCDSYKYSDALCGDCDAAKPELTQLKLKLFYKFSRSGLVNEVDPRQFCLKAHDVTVNSEGAHFKGHSGSYLSTETPGFWEFFKLGSQYSALVRVQHQFSSGYQFYHRFQQCDGSSGNTFAKGNTSTYNAAVLKRSAQDEALFAISLNYLPTDGLQRVISVGFTFSGVAHQKFYKNGSSDPVYYSYTSPTTYSVSLFDCLNLGYSPSNSNCLNGSMHCYGFSTKVLNESEFQQLQLLCDQD